MTVTKTVIAPNSLGKDKKMDLNEYVRRAVTDHRRMAYDGKTMAIAQKLYSEQKAFAELCFNNLYAEQNKDVMPSVDWFKVPEEINYITIDQESHSGMTGLVLGFAKEPVKHYSLPMWRSSTENDQTIMIDEDCAAEFDFKPGHVVWYDSMIKRPGI